MQENVADMVSKNRQAKGVKNGFATLDDLKVIEILNSKETQKNIAKKYNVSQSTVSRLLTGEQWGHVLPEIKRFKKLIHGKKQK